MQHCFECEEETEFDELCYVGDDDFPSLCPKCFEEKKQEDALREDYRGAPLT